MSPQRLLLSTYYSPKALPPLPSFKTLKPDKRILLRNLVHILVPIWDLTSSNGPEEARTRGLVQSTESAEVGWDL